MRVPDQGFTVQVEMGRGIKNIPEINLVELNDIFFSEWGGKAWSVCLFVKVLIQLGNQAKAKSYTNQDITFITIQAETWSVTCLLPNSEPLNQEDLSTLQW